MLNYIENNKCFQWANGSLLNRLISCLPYKLEFYSLSRVPDLLDVVIDMYRLLSISNIFFKYSSQNPG